MSTKIFKKIRKAAKARVDETFGTGFEALGKMLHKKPRWLPAFIYIIPFAIIFKRQVLKYAWRICREKK